MDREVRQKRMNENSVCKALLHRHRLRKNDGGIGRVSSWKGRDPQGFPEQRLSTTVLRKMCGCSFQQGLPVVPKAKHQCSMYF